MILKKMFTSPGFSISTNQRIANITSKKVQNFVVAYTPRRVTGPVSLVSSPNLDAVKMSTDPTLVTIPANSIVDRVEFYGNKNFNTTGTFDIGLGQLNTAIFNMLVEDSTSSIANSKTGGLRTFTANNTDGSNDNPVVLVNSYINIVPENPITSGYLTVVIYFRNKLVA